MPWVRCYTADGSYYGYYVKKCPPEYILRKKEDELGAEYCVCIESREERVKEVIYEVINECRIHEVAQDIGEIMELASKLKVIARKDVVRNFLAAYLVVKGYADKRTADKVVASSSKGRRKWEKRIRSFYSENTSGLVK